ncbi:MAG: MipA/OmpV family protein [Pseudomonadota bacterium]|nr:MipA/OmpV family protein [Sphingomonas sp.]MDQ3479692.1 MipA/OmpV family protein [Pseudomonadota bacterium]
MKIALALTALAAAIMPGSQALAQDSERTIRIRPGLGAQTRPEYPGADKSEVVPYIKFSIARGDNPFGFSAPDDAFGIALLSMGPLRAGPALAIQGGRKDSDVGVPLGKVKSTVEVGGFAEVLVMDQFRLRADLRKGIGGHEGLVGSIGADQIWRDGDRYAISVGPRLLYSDSRYQRAYFGVTPQAALATGLPAYRPDGGFHAVAAAAGLHYALSGPLGLFGYARYERLIGDARKSPVVRELGSPNQMSAGLGISYTLTVRK